MLNEEVPLFTTMKISHKEHPFKKISNMVYMLPEDGNTGTEIIQALIERKLLNYQFRTTSKFQGKSEIITILKELLVCIDFCRIKF